MENPVFCSTMEYNLSLSPYSLQLPAYISEGKRMQYLLGVHRLNCMNQSFLF